MEDYKRTVSASNVNVIIENRHKILSGDFSFNVISESKKYIKIYTKNIPKFIFGKK